MTGTRGELEIRRLQERLARAFENRDFEAVLGCYAADAVLLAPGKLGIGWLMKYLNWG